jgi:hypothetical protein
MAMASLPRTQPGARARSRHPSSQRRTWKHWESGGRCTSVTYATCAPGLSFRGGLCARAQRGTCEYPAPTQDRSLKAL